MKGIIYKSKNKINGKNYVGQTIQGLKQRKQKHLNSVLNGSDYYFHRAIRKYGFENFQWKIIEILTHKNENKLMNILNHREQHFILYFDTFGNGYNSTNGGLNCLYSEKTKNKLSEKKTKYYENPENRKKLSDARKGIIKSEEHKRKISKSRKDQKPSDKTKKKMSISKSKEWIIFTPGGEIFDTKGISQYCKQYGLSTGDMSNVANGKHGNHKGYICWRIPGIIFKEVVL